MPSFGYRNAPALISWRASSYFDLDSAQQAEFKARLERVHAWHRREQLPQMIGTLREARQRIERPVSLADADWLIASMQDHYRQAVGRIVDESADLLATLKLEQIDALERELADVDEEFVEEWIDASPERIRRERFERVLKRAQEWLGRLEPAQRQWLRQRLDRFPTDYRTARADRLRRQAEFLALLRGEAAMVRTAAGGETVRARLKRWAIDWDYGRTPDELARIDRFMRDYGELYVELINGATPVQRDHLRRRLDAYVEGLSQQLP